jgi:glycine/D-amino acid oxidase-like deaminating enzyme
MRVDFIVVGQGLAGTWLSYFLLNEGASILVVDGNAGLKPASSAASGLINPITGKRLARQAMAEQLLPFAAEAYAEMESQLGLGLSETIPIHTFFSSAEEADFFEKKANASHGDLLHFGSRVEGDEHFTAPCGNGSIYPAQLINLQALLAGWREQLKARNALREEAFDWDACALTENSARYKDIEARAVIDCCGAATAYGPYFQALPFALNKGEAIIADIPGLPREAVYKHAHLSIVPWQEGRFWIGSTFDWDFTDALPTAAFREKATSILEQWLRLPVYFEAHFAAIRPATVTRDAFMGMHPRHPALGILNGFGSKGCMLAPFLAHNFTQHLLRGEPLLPQADVARYARVLSR